VFRHLACNFNRCLANWNNGANFTGICDAWQTRAMAIGTVLTVSLENTPTTGLYGGLDADGALLLNVCGEIRRVLFGDVMSPAPGDNSKER
jgi:biotin-(acetyl-CoA carboxylase) ligase